MSKRGIEHLPPTSSNRKKFIFWILAIALSLIAIKRALAPNGKGATRYDLEHFQQLNSISPVIQRTSSARTADSGSSLFDIPGREERAVATILSSESFASGVLALGHSIQAANITSRRVLLYFPDRLTIRTLCHLQSNGWELHPIAHASSKRDRYLKLQLWTLDQLDIKRVVYLEEDALVQQNFDELWELPFKFAAVPSVRAGTDGFSMEFSTGMMLLHTSTPVFGDMLNKIDIAECIDLEPTQCFLNTYFAAQVLRLPYIYNADLAIKQSSPTLWEALKAEMRVVRFSTVKPFFEEERKIAEDAIWETEMGWWESTWQETFKELAHRC